MTSTSPQSDSVPFVTYSPAAPPPSYSSVEDAENANLAAPVTGKSISASLLGDKVLEKDRHPSPSPLGTADGNVASAATSTATVPAASVPAKTTKRTAGATTGADKRKKALKRL
jgi:ubiquitin-conjugating enzyme E2 S